MSLSDVSPSLPTNPPHRQGWIRELPQEADRGTAGEPDSIRSRWRWAFLNVVGVAMLVVWGAWWINSVRKDHLVSGHHFWFSPLPELAGDFVHNIDHPSRVWVQGGNPYEDNAKTFCFSYPPLVPRLFAWSSLLMPRTAMVTWLAVLAATAAAGALLAWRSRHALRLTRVPWPIVLAAALFSTPIIMEMERSNCNLLVLILLLAAMGILKKSDSWIANILAGAILAVAFWTKLYPGLLLLGFVALGRWRILPSFVATATAIGLSDLTGLKRCVANLKRLAPLCRPNAENFYRDIHTLSGSWDVILAGTKLDALTRVPGIVAAVALVGPLLLWVSYRVYRCDGRERIAYPYLLWVLALATFIPSVAVDYNLFFLPMAALAVWDRRDPVIVHVLMGLLLLWWQPLALPIDGRTMLVFKLLGLFAVGISLAGRIREQSRPAVAAP